MSRRGGSSNNSPQGRSSQPAIFQPSSGASALYGGPSPNSPSSLGQQLSPGSLGFVNQFFAGADQTGLGAQKLSPGNEFWRQPVLAQPATFQSSSALSLSGRRQQPGTVTVVPPQQPSCIVNLNLSPGTTQMAQNFFACADQTGFQHVKTSPVQPATFSPSSRSPRLL